MTMYNTVEGADTMNYGSILAKYRKEKGLSQVEVSDYINKFCDKPCTNKAVSHWETGDYLPPLEQFFLLCDLYGIDDIKGVFHGVERDFKGLVKLNTQGRRRVEEYIALLSGSPLFAETDADEIAYGSYLFIKLYDIPVAAGTGSFLDSASYEEFAVDDSVPKEADFAVRVSGDSMTPRFVDRQIIFIKKQKSLNPGEIGIFELDGDAYVKKLGYGELLSLNPQYKPIRIHEDASFHIFGKVVG